MAKILQNFVYDSKDHSLKWFLSDNYTAGNIKFSIKFLEPTDWGYVGIVYSFDGSLQKLPNSPSLPFRGLSVGGFELPPPDPPMDPPMMEGCTDKLEYKLTETSSFESIVR